MSQKKSRSRAQTAALGAVIAVLSVALLSLVIARSKVQATLEETPVSPSAAAVTVDATPVPEGETVAAEVTPETVTPTPEPTPVPEPEYFTISMVGDCSMASNPDKKGWAIAYESVIRGDMSYPFANTKQYFEDDYLTIANLEGNLSDSSYSSIEWFTFLSPTSYANILTEGGVDFVTLANNHTMDFGQNAYNDTVAALNAVNLPYGGENETYIYQRDDGLRVGLYCMYNRLTYNSLSLLNAQTQESTIAESRTRLDEAVKKLRDEGCEFVVACLHMGREGYYEPTEVQTEMCRYAVDAGFNLVYCTHAHRLQPAEQYGDGLIFYGMGNWTFGGHTNPGNGTDKGSYDTGIARITVCRRGTEAVIDSYDFIPCSISSGVDTENFVPNANSLNNYQPTPYTPDSPNWNRTMSMLNGTYEGANYVTDYGNVLQGMHG